VLNASYGRPQSRTTLLGHLKYNLGRRFRVALTQCIVLWRGRAFDPFLGLAGRFVGWQAEEKFIKSLRISIALILATIHYF
jgi:hypothetical protein